MEIDVIWACYICVHCCSWTLIYSHLKRRRCSHVSESNIKAGLTALWFEGAEWIQRGQDRVERCAAVNAAMNF
jgi:hypothetical protein